MREYMPTISVLMSVYNETKSELSTSIDSILNQTYQNFEFIIVNDNPQNNLIREIINSYAKQDERIKAIFNEQNIGLAASLNKAASVAIGEYYLRMDADDISELHRIERQLRKIKEYDYDLVCSDYYFIDENGNLLDREVKIFNNDNIIRMLPKQNVIHHPTVLMKSKVFHDLNGYRNFPCAQDYDLWLRMVANKYTIHMIPEKLLYYRIRKNSITGKNKLKQMQTIKYIRMIFKDYQKTGIDQYNYSNYIDFLKKVEDEKTIRDFDNYYSVYQEGLGNIKNKRIIEGLKKVIPIIIRSKYFRLRILEKIKFF
ncbi:glycosyltransferase [Peribacillus frigoritolerans]|uniref:glycosyltransferase n=1 Tax=Peribacillus frigoritolerans TaxID=450367 RepID=UPI00228280E0|nr:glycosyltransferase [Peribacillus frigoritolerans]MCY9140973.1 glycosyltransferase [Peribacillus frigoritolerans]